MMEILPWAVLLLLVVAGLAALGRRKHISPDEYEDRKGRGAGVGNALLAMQEILEPQRGKVLEMREEKKEEEEPPGDPPEAGKKAGR